MVRLHPGLALETAVPGRAARVPIQSARVQYPQAGNRFLSRRNFRIERYVSLLFADGSSSKLPYIPIFAYDARKNTPDRTEWRLYYSTDINSPMESMQPGDLLLFFRDLDHLLNVVVCSNSHELRDPLEQLIRANEATLFDSDVSETIVQALNLRDRYVVRSTALMIRAAEETLGSKVKGWYQPHEASRIRLLYKKSRDNTNEHWVEKFTAELASLLDLPVARLDLAIDENNSPGVLSYSFLSHVGSTNKALGPRPSDFIEANRILHEFDSSYDPDLKRQQSDYTLNTISEALELKMGDRARSAFRKLLQYFIFDCWIGNTDRHHENWGIQIYTSREAPYYELSPTYDHGAALAATRTPEAKKVILANGIQRFYDRGRSAIYDPKISTKKALSFRQLIHACFTYESKTYGAPEACMAIATRICTIPPFAFQKIFDRLPTELGLTDTDRKFTFSYLQTSRDVIQEFTDSFSDLAT